MTTLSSDTQSGAQGSFGSMLQQAREHKKISLETAAADLFILKRYLKALEDEQFSELPQVAFARGFAINYAKYLDLDAAEIASRFDAAYPDELKAKSVTDAETPLRPMGKLQRDGRSRIRFNPLLILGAIALIVLVVFLFRMVSGASSDNGKESVSTIDEVSTLEQSAGAAINSGIDTDSIGASGSALNLGDASANTAFLNVTLTDDTVVSITDASGSSLISGTQTAGDYDLLGTPPFEVQIDNIDNVSLMLNQEAVNLNTYATDNTATFELIP